MASSGYRVDEFENVFEFPNTVFGNLEQEIEYLPSENSKITVYGKLYTLPRQLVGYGDYGLSYTFSGLTVPCKPWTPLLNDIKSTVEKLCGCGFNFVLINRYRDGNDSIGQHKDNERDLLKDYPIASVSLGEERQMIFKRPGFADICLKLKHNSMIVMKAPTNKLWSHGIPAEKDKKGVRVNLTFRKIIPNNNKRKIEECLAAETSKKEKINTNKSGAFTDIPDNMFPVGEDIFVAVTTFRGETVLHIRRYKKYGKTFYPTKEGVTLTPWQFDRLFSRPIPATHLDLEIALQLLFDDFRVETTDFNNFLLNNIITSKSITITLHQWRNIKDYTDDILTSALDFIFREMDFKSVFEQVEDNLIDDSLPCSLDVSTGTDYLSRLLYKVISDLMKEKHGIVDPIKYDDDIICNSNSISDFNSAALYLNPNEIAIHFREELWINQPFLALPPAKYVTVDFLNSVALDKFIRKAREEFCPPCVE